MQRIPDKKQSKAGQYHLSHEEAELLAKHRQRRRKPARRRTGTADEPRGLLNTLLAILIVLAIVYVVAQIAGGI